MSPTSRHRTAPVPVLFLVADTGGGHRSAASAVAEALRRGYPGRFAPVLLDPLAGPDSPWLLRRVVRLYGPVIRHAPWLWGAVYRATDRDRVTRLLRRTLLRHATGPVTDAVTGLRPAVVVSCHPLTTDAAVTATRRRAHRTPVVTVVTDLVAVHATWPHDRADRVVVASAAARRRCVRAAVDTDRCVDVGLPVPSAIQGGPPSSGERDLLRRVLGVGAGFLVVVTGGGEGSGGITRTVRALLDGVDDVAVVAICGRNDRARRSLAALAPRAGGRLIVRGFVPDMADWLRCADIVVTKAGPSTIAEATCCGAALLLTSHLPGQEDGNVEFVTAAGAGRYTPQATDVVREVGRLRTQPADLDAMRTASSRLARPRAADRTAALIADLARPGPRWSPLPYGWPGQPLPRPTRQLGQERHGRHPTTLDR